METAGNKDFEKETEKKGLGTPATRASIIEKLVFSKYAIRKGKQISCTEDGKLLIEVVPDYLKSAALTAERENKLLEMEKGNLTDQSFLEGIKGMVMLLISDCRKLSSEQTHKFDTRKSIGTCPVCGNPVYVERRISIAPIVIVPLFCGKKITFLKKWVKRWMKQLQRHFCKRAG